MQKSNCTSIKKRYKRYTYKIDTNDAVMLYKPFNIHLKYQRLTQTFPMVGKLNNAPTLNCTHIMCVGYVFSSYQTKQQY
jgi:hypothetical protein